MAKRHRGFKVKGASSRKKHIGALKFHKGKGKRGKGSPK